MSETSLKTWRGIASILQRLVADGREPDAWVAIHVSAAIKSLAKGEGDPLALDRAAAPFAQRRRGPWIGVDGAPTLDELRASFLVLPVPGGHP